MRNYLIFAFLVLLMFSCRTTEENRILQTTKVIENNKKFDSLLYYQLSEILQESFVKNSVDSLSIFFEKWEKESEKLNSKITDSVTANIYKIFYASYYPFDYTKYGWQSREFHNKYEYYIPQNKIPFSIENKKDTIFNFYPINQFQGRKSLNTIPEFENALYEFLERSYDEGEYFMENLINLPINYFEIEFRTTPEIKNIEMNKKMNKAKVKIRLESTGLELNMKKIKNNWQILNVKSLWIE